MPRRSDRLTRPRPVLSRRRRPPSAAAPPRASAARASLGPGALALWLAVFAGLALLLYEPALDGEFISDDQHYVRENPYIHELSAENLREIWNPRSVLVLVVENFAPVHLMLHALEWQAFGTDTYGYHVVNVLVHALAAWLLVPLLRRSGLPAGVAVAGGLLFLVHPVNVEAVAWISQLKSSSALALAIGALLAQPRRPWLGTLLFALALLAKPSALFALPVAWLFAWIDPATTRRHWAWLGAWLLVFAAFAAVEVPAFENTAGRVPVLYEDLGVRVRTSFAIGLRYLAVVATGRGLSTFHEPPPAESWLDPWWLGALAVFGLMGWRIAVVLRGRRPEAAWWAWAASSFSAVCGLVLPLPFPMADRYVYFILPGLIGAGLLAGAEAAAWLRPRLAATGLADPRRARAAAGAGVAAAALVLAAFAGLTHARAAIWQSAHRMMADAERNYPEGLAARTRQATRAAQAGDLDGAVEALRAAHRRGYSRLDHLVQEPAYAVLRGDPRFQALLVQMADEHLARLEGNPDPSQLELHVMALAYYVRKDVSAAVRVLERGVAKPGPITDKLRADLERMRALERRGGLRRDAAAP